MKNKGNLFAKALRCLHIKKSREPSLAQETLVSGTENLQSAPAADFTGVYKGYLLTLEEAGGEEFKQLEGECTCLLNQDKDGNATASIYLSGESIGGRLTVSTSLYTLTLHGVLWSSAFEGQGTFCIKNRVMMLTVSGILKDIGTKIRLDLVRVDEWKRPINK